MLENFVVLACIGCGICAKNCSYGAIEIKDNLAVVEQRYVLKNVVKQHAVAKCPTGAIRIAKQLKAHENAINLKATS